jgi:putative sigma-54 modulation protein
MKISTTSRHYDLAPALRDYAESKVEHLTNFFDNIVSAHIIFSLEKYRHSCEVTLHVNGRDMVGKDTSEDMYASVDRVVEKLERQILKHKGKLKKKSHEKIAEMDAVLPDESAADEEDAETEIIPADPLEFPRMTMDEAVAALNENGKTYSIFSNRATKRLNVLFKREDGSIGVIEAAN